MKFKVGDEIVRTEKNGGNNTIYARRITSMGGKLTDIVKVISTHFSGVGVSFNGKEIEGRWSYRCFKFSSKIRSWKKVMERA